MGLAAKKEINPCRRIRHASKSGNDTSAADQAIALLRDWNGYLPFRNRPSPCAPVPTSSITTSRSESDPRLFHPSLFCLFFTPKTPNQAVCYRRWRSITLALYIWRASAKPVLPISLQSMLGEQLFSEKGRNARTGKSRACRHVISTSAAMLN